MREEFYQNIELLETWTMRVCTALMVNRATSRDKAIVPRSLPRKYEDNIHDPIVRGYVKTINGRVYLTTRGNLIADRGIKKLVDNGMWPSITE